MKKISIYIQVAPKYIKLYLLFLALFNTFTAYAQTSIIQGKVTSMAGQPLVGVTIMVKGTTNGTTTDQYGKYNIPANPGDSLVYSYIGYLQQDIAVKNKRMINIQLQSSSSHLNQLVVIGYGTQKKVNLTGAIGTASGERLENRAIANVGEGLEGVIPNLNVTPQSGDPTESPEINIRGYESINGGSPLILVDGVPMDINRVNPNDIKSISVLKDAAASAVYGARAAYGVILVTTKTGQPGKVRVSLNTMWSSAMPIFNMDPVTDPYTTVLAWNKASIRTEGHPMYDSSMVAGTKAWSEHPGTAPEWGVEDGALQFYGNNNYQHKIMRDHAPTQQHNLTLSGGSKDADYFVSFGYLNKDGYLRYNNDKFKRYNILMKGRFNVAKWLTLDEKIVFNAQYSNKPHVYTWDVSINSLARNSPTNPIQFPDLKYYLEPGDHDNYAQYIGMYFDGITNFFPYLMNGGRTVFTNSDTWLTQGVTLTPLKGLKINSDFSYNIYNKNYQDNATKVDVVSTNLTSSQMVSHGYSGNDYVNNEDTHNVYYVFNAYAEYTMDHFLNHNHHVKIMLGFNQESGKNKLVRARANTLITPLVTDINATVGDQQTFGSSSDIALRGAFGRLNYNFKDRYLIEFDGRYDGTSRFPKNSRFGFFPSFSAGWRISNEGFMTGTNKWLDNLKIRASYGSLGNQSVGSFYPYIPTMSIGTSPYIMSDGRIPYVSAPGLVSSSLTWETVISKDIGLDFSLFNSRFDGSFDVYTRATENMLMNVEYPAILGATAPKSNAADLKTTGWELSLTWQDNIGKDWKYNFTLALSNWSAEITKYDNPTGALSEYYVGEKLGEIWGYETEGIFQTKEEVSKAADQSAIGSNWRPGDIRYEDLNNDGFISSGNNTLSNPGDRKVIGNSTPKYNFGINAGVSYKAFNLVVFFQGILRRDYWPPTDSWDWFFPFNASYTDKYFLTETWSENNRNAYFPAPHISSDTKKNLQVQSRYLQNAGYMRLKNIRLSYDLPLDLIKKIGFGQAQVYFAGMNLWEYSPIHRPLDPETIYSQSITYPMQRIISLGVNLSF